MSTLHDKARGFIYRNARPLELARWQYHFEDGDAAAVLKALSAYQNEDGGFGHDLEQDSWNPNSSPIQTWAATEIIRELHVTNSDQPIIQGILRYLESGADFDQGFWANVVPSNNDYPHAPWWHYDSEDSGNNSYNPTAALAGFILHYANPDSSIYQLGHRLAKEAVTHFLQNGYNQDMHILACYIALYEYTNGAVIDQAQFIAKLKEAVNESITRDTSLWGHSYICRTSQFFSHRDSVFFPDNQAIAAFECRFIRDTQEADGSWSIPWSWADYLDAWPISRNRWQSHVIISNLLFLKGIES